MDMLHTQTVTKAGPFTKFLLMIAGVDEATLAHCPPHDWGVARAVGVIMICVWLYQATVFSVVCHRLFAAPGQIRPDLVLASMFIATFIMMIDSYMVMRSNWHLSGIAELKRGGLDISGGPLARIKAAFFLTIRILLSIALAQLTAIFFSLIIFDTDIVPRIESIYQQANAPLIAATTARVDAEIQRATEAVTAASAQVDGLSAQITALRQNTIDPSANDPQLQQAQQEITQLLAEKAKADEELRAAETFASNELAGVKGASGNSGRVGHGAIYQAAVERVANAKDHAQEAARAVEAARARLDALHKQQASANSATKQRSQDQLPGFENARAAADARLASLKDQLTNLNRGRDAAIRNAVEQAPDHVSRDDGLLAQIRALELIAQDDPKIAAVTILVDLIAFGFEMAAVLAKVTSFVPTTYAALLARDAYLRVVRIVDEMMAELNSGASNNDPEAGMRPRGKPAKDGPHSLGPILAPAAPFGSPGEPPPQPPKRPRGRPRKSPLN